MDIRISRTTLAIATFIVAAAFAACGRRPNGTDTTTVKGAKSLDEYDSHAPISLKGETLKSDSMIWGYLLRHHIDGKLIVQCWDCRYSLWVGFTT